jgi:hypothetical protein
MASIGPRFAASITPQTPLVSAACRAPRSRAHGPCPAVSGPISIGDYVPERKSFETTMRTTRLVPLRLAFHEKWTAPSRRIVPAPCHRPGAVLIIRQIVVAFALLGNIATTLGAVGIAGRFVVDDSYRVLAIAVEVVV